jgi:hypothetical protein
VLDVAKQLATRRPRGRGVIFASFDGEEPPYFLTAAMGSEHFVRHPIVPLSQIDLMICMDLVGHRLGSSGLPDAVTHSLFALDAEPSTGTATRRPGDGRAWGHLALARGRGGAASVGLRSFLSPRHTLPVLVGGAVASLS